MSGGEIRRIELGVGEIGVLEHGVAKIDAAQIQSAELDRGKLDALPGDLDQALPAHRPHGLLDREANALANLGQFILEPRGGDQRRQGLKVKIRLLGIEERQQPGRTDDTLAPFGRDQKFQRFGQRRAKPILPLLGARVPVSPPGQERARNGDERRGKRTEARRQRILKTALGVVLDLLADELLASLLAVEVLLVAEYLGGFSRLGDDHAGRKRAPELEHDRQSQDDIDDVLPALRPSHLLPTKPGGTSPVCRPRLLPDLGGL